MNQHVINTALSRKKPTTLWTPWGSQRVPDLDKALDIPVRRPPARPPAPVAPRLEKIEPVLR